MFSNKKESTEYKITSAPLPKTSLTSINSLDYKKYITDIIDTIDEVSDNQKILNIDYMTRKIANYIYLKPEWRKKFTKILKPLVQNNDTNLVSSLLYLRCHSQQLIMDVSQYQRTHKIPEFPLIGYLQILNSLIRTDTSIVPELMEFYNAEQTTLREKMSIADIIDRVDNVLGGRLLNEIRVIEEAQQVRVRGKKRTIYSDSQNVHNNSINSKVQDIIGYLCSEYSTSEDMISKFESHYQKIPFDIRKSLERIQIDIANYHGYSLLDLFKSLMNYIEKHSQRDDMIERLKDELMEMSGYCSTGHAARLVNVLQGFDVEPELILKIDIFEEVWAIFNNYMYEYLKDKDEIMELLIEDPHEFCKKIDMDDFEKQHLQEYELEKKDVSNLKVKLLEKYTGLNKHTVSQLIS
jgi:hypothetical protein